MKCRTKGYRRKMKKFGIVYLAPARASARHMSSLARKRLKEVA